MTLVEDIEALLSPPPPPPPPSTDHTSQNETSSLGISLTLPPPPPPPPPSTSSSSSTTKDPNRRPTYKTISIQYTEKEKRERRYECQYCKKRFTRPSSLTSHVYTHTGERPFACDFPGCSKRFSVLSNLRRHYKVHASRKTYSSGGRKVQSTLLASHAMRNGLTFGHHNHHNHHHPLTLPSYHQSYSYSGAPSLGSINLSNIGSNSYAPSVRTTSNMMPTKNSTTALDSLFESMPAQPDRPQPATGLLSAFTNTSSLDALGMLATSIAASAESSSDDSATINSVLSDLFPRSPEIAAPNILTNTSVTTKAMNGGISRSGNSNLPLDQPKGVFPPNNPVTDMSFLGNIGGMVSDKPPSRSPDSINTDTTTSTITFLDSLKPPTDTSTTATAAGLPASIWQQPSYPSQNS